LAGTQVYFHSVPGPILFAGANQINAIVPFEITGQTVNVMVQVNEVASNTASLPQPAADPQVFQSLDPTLPGFSFAIAVNQDGTLNSQQNPANPGTIETLLTLTPTDGERAPSYLIPVLPVGVETCQGYFEGTPSAPWMPCQVFYAGSMPRSISGPHGPRSKALDSRTTPA
jgi:uncharacterized protein (TIGR03437 family)